MMNILGFQLASDWNSAFMAVSSVKTQLADRLRLISKEICLKDDECDIRLVRIIRKVFKMLRQITYLCF
jgi:hypothetical protein